MARSCEREWYRRRANDLERTDSLSHAAAHFAGGSTILYSATSGGADQFNNLYILPITGGAPYKLTFGSFDHFHPRWSPDGQRIAYISNEEGLPQLSLLEVWGGEQRKVVITHRKWRRPMGRLQVKVLDATTSKPTRHESKDWLPMDGFILPRMRIRESVLSPDRITFTRQENFRWMRRPAE